MKAICIGNTFKELKNEVERVSFQKNVNLEQVHLVKGQVYPVFGLSMSDGALSFLICEDGIESDYLIPHLAGFFRLENNIIPCDWSVCTSPSNAGDYAIIPKPWASDPAFLEKLVDGEPGANRFFDELKSRYFKEI